MRMKVRVRLIGGMEAHLMSWEMCDLPFCPEDAPLSDFCYFAGMCTK